MKKWIMFLSFILLITSCGNTNGDPYVLAEPQNKEVIINDDILNDAVNERMIPYASNFISTFVSKEEEKNNVCSPISLYLTLSMMSDITKGDAQKEILDALKMKNLKEARTYSNLFYAVSNGEGRHLKMNTVNSLWMEETINFKKNKIYDLYSHHNSYVMRVPFFKDNKLATNKINDFVFEKTNNFLKTNFVFPISTSFVLLNSFYFSGNWDYKELDYTEETYNFVNYDKSVKKTKLLERGLMNIKILKEEEFSSCYSLGKAGFNLIFILPNEGKDIKEVMNKDNISRAISYDYPRYSEDKTTTYKTNVLFPEFEIENTLGLAKHLKDLGITSVFNIDKCDLSPLVRKNGGKMALDDVIQANRIRVNSVGVEGASATLGTWFTGPHGDIVTEKEEINNFVVDRSFGYIIVDRKYNIPLFGGIIYSI